MDDYRVKILNPQARIMLKFLADLKLAEVSAYIPVNRDQVSERNEDMQKLITKMNENRTSGADIHGLKSIIDKMRGSSI